MPGHNFINIFQFLKKEILSDEFHCQKCKKTDNVRQFSIWRLPNILVIHLKRFCFSGYGKFYGGGGGTKLNNKIRFPTKNLDLSDYISESDH